MVRDYNFRGHSAQATLKMWPSVQAGTNKHIFPYQNSADTAFNSALDYELGVLKVYAEPLLRTVKPTCASMPRLGASSPSSTTSRPSPRRACPATAY